MKKYIVLITSIVGRKGDVVELPSNSQTQERLDRGIVKAVEVESFKPEEKKIIKPINRKAKK